MQTKAAVLTEINQPLKLLELTIPNLKPGQLLVEMVYSGVCHTQLLEIRGKKGKDKFLPHTLGHEGSGVVLEVGEGVKKVKAGNRVVLLWIKGNGVGVPTTEYKNGHTKINAGAVTTFMNTTETCENRVTKIPETMPFKEACLLGCAIPTGFGMVMKTARVHAGSRVAVFGAGGIGLFANDFHFEDLTAIVKKQWIIDFSRVLVERNLQVTWQLPSGTRSEAIDEEVMEWMQKAGAKNLSYAPESGSERILKAIKKRVSLDHLLKAAKTAIAHKMILQVNIVLGFPEETFLDVLKTYWFVLRCGFIGFSEIHIACFYPLPNMEQYFNLQKKGVLPSEDALNDDYFYTLFRGINPKRPISWNERFSDGQMKGMILLGYALFFSALFLARPWRAATLLFHVLSGKSELKTERILIGTFQKIFRLNQAP